MVFKKRLMSVKENRLQELTERDGGRGRERKRRESEERESVCA